MVINKSLGWVRFDSLLIVVREMRFGRASVRCRDSMDDDEMNGVR